MERERKMNGNSSNKKLFKNKKEQLLFFVVSFYVTFSLVGHKIFLPLEKTNIF